jgi:dTDP-4-dehydrorhamnose 3,5-epimerase
MALTIHPTNLPGVLLIEPDVKRDQRGYFLETYSERKYRELGITEIFVQDNLSHSSQNVLRGLHYQLKHPQGKLISVTAGKVFDVAVDIRFNSPTFGKWAGVILDTESCRQLYIPSGFAHGFCVLGGQASLVYKCTDFYYGDDDFGIAWDDPSLRIEWPIANPILSAKDATLRRLDQIPQNELPIFSK